MVVLFLVSVLVFVGTRALIADPMRMVVTHDEQLQMSQAQIEKTRHDAGLDRNLVVQYVSWMGGLLKGNMGTSVSFGDPVAPDIVRGLSITLETTLLAWIIGTFIGLLAGILCAIRRGTWVDTLVTSLANVGASVPIFFLVIILMYILSVRLHWLPVGGYISPFEDLGGNVRQIIMPVMCLAFFPMVVACRQGRSALVGAGHAQIAIVWSEGSRRHAVIPRHAFRNSLARVSASAGMTLGAVIGGAVIVEAIFGIPGLGRLTLTSVGAQDYPYLQGIVLVLAIVVLVVSFLGDLLHFWLDRQSAVSGGDLKAGIVASDIAEDSDAALRASGFARFRRVFLTRFSVKVGLVILAVFLLSAIFAPLIAPHNAPLYDTNALQSPSWSHPLGTDMDARDTLRLLVYGSRTALIVGVSAAAIAAVVGGLLGLAAGFLGRWVNVPITWVMDALLAIPLLLLALAVIALVGSGMRNVILVLSVGMVPVFMRVMRGVVLQVKDNDHVLGLRSTQAHRWRILVNHAFRSCLRPFVAVMITMVGVVILVESCLSFLGARVNPSGDWGRMVSEGRDLTSTPWLFFVPGVAIVLVVFALIVVGDGLRDTLDPRLRGTI